MLLLQIYQLFSVPSFRLLPRNQHRFDICTETGRRGYSRQAQFTALYHLWARRLHNVEFLFHSEKRKHTYTNTSLTALVSCFKIKQCKDHIQRKPKLYIEPQDMSYIHIPSIINDFVIFQCRPWDLNIFFLTFWLYHMACGTLAPHAGIEPAPPQ